MKQRLVMCAAFLHRPQAVLVDEPMVGLDPRGAKLIKSVFKRMSERGVAILMSTHTLEVAQEMCDRISIILKGQIIARGTVDELRALAGSAGGAQQKASRGADAGVSEADRRQRPAGDRRDRLMQPFPYLLLPAYWSSRNRARRLDRADLVRAWLFGGVGLLVFAALFWGVVLDHDPARCVRRARRFSAPHRPVVAVPHVPVVPRVQRRRHRAVDLLSVGRSAAAAGGADRRPAAFLRAIREDRAAVVVDGRRVPAAGAAGRRHRPLRAVHVLRDGAAHGRAVLRHSCCDRHRARRCCSSTSFRRAARATS